MTMHRRRRAAPISMVAAALMVAAGCGTDNDAAGTDGEAGGTLRIGADSTVVAIDPHEYSAESAVLTVSLHVYDTLVRAEGDEFVPSLAESWETPDDTTWIFHLRDDVEFHDGTPFTAEHFVGSLERLLDLEAAQAPLWASLDDAEATDDHTVTITTKEPMGTMLSSLALLFVLPVEQVDDPDFFRAPIGTGAYQVEEFLPDERTVLVRNENYWGDPPNLDQIEFHEIPELSTRLTAVETGEIDLTWGIPQDQVGTFVDHPDLEYGSAPSYVYSFIWYNHTREPFQDVRVRRALWHALDLETVVNDIMGDTATVAQAPIPQPVFGASQQDLYEYDPDLARDLLEEAGYGDGLELEMQYNENHFSNIRDVAAAFVSYWADVGVTVTPMEKQRAEWLEDLGAKNYDLNLQGNTVQSGDADYTLGRLYTCEADRMGYCNEELDALLAAGRTELDLDERERIYDDAARIIWEDAVGIFPMDFERNAVWQSYVQGFEPPVSIPDLHNVSVEQ